MSTRYYKANPSSQRAIYFQNSYYEKKFNDVIYNATLLEKEHKYIDAYNEYENSLLGQYKKYNTRIDLIKNKLPILLYKGEEYYRALNLIYSFDFYINISQEFVDNCINKYLDLINKDISNSYSSSFYNYKSENILFEHLKKVQLLNKNV